MPKNPPTTIDTDVDKRVNIKEADEETSRSKIEEATDLTASDDGINIMLATLCGTNAG